MTSQLKPEDIKRLEGFIKSCEACPQILWMPELQFFREYIEKLGGTVPKADKSDATSATQNESPSEECPKMEAEEEPEQEPVTPESEESEVELDKEGLVEPETIDLPEMGDSSKVVSDEDEMAASEKRNEAMDAVAEGDFDKAVQCFTEAIKLNPGSAMLYAKRASILLKQKRVKAALKDCDEAIKLNPDSAAAYKFRGRTHRLLGNWLEAAKDLRLACRLDFDDQANEWLKEVEPNALKLEEHQRKHERKRFDKEVIERQERIRKAREEHKKAQEKEYARSKSYPGGMPGGMPFGMPGGMPFSMPGGQPGSMPGGGVGMPDFGEIFKDPDIVAAMQDPEISAAFQDVSSNPANIFKYQSNPKVSSVINKLIKKFGGDAMPGGGSSDPGFPGDFSSAPPPSAGDDLD